MNAIEATPPGADSSASTHMSIDCHHCLVRSPSACGDCVVSVLLDVPSLSPSGECEVQVQPGELDAMAELARSGLVPPLRLVLPSAAPEPSENP